MFRSLMNKNFGKNDYQLLSFRQFKSAYWKNCYRHAVVLQKVIPSFWFRIETVEIVGDFNA